MNPSQIPGADTSQQLGVMTGMLQETMLRLDRNELRHQLDEARMVRVMTISIFAAAFTGALSGAAAAIVTVFLVFPAHGL